MSTPLPPIPHSSPLLHAAKVGARTLLCCCLLVFAVACSSEYAEEQPVSWPELTQFDEIALRAERLARSGDLDTLGDLHSELLRTGRAITEATIPSNARDPQQVRTILADLDDLMDGLDAGGADESMTPLVLGLHPITASLMEAAGMPHVHNHSAHDDHEDHDDHGGEHGDHDHGEHDHSGHDHGDHDHAGHDHGDHDHGDHCHEHNDGEEEQTL